MDAQISTWVDCFAADAASNLYIIGPERSCRDNVIGDLLTGLPGLDFERIAYGELAAAASREHRLLPSPSADPWSDERIARAIDVPVLVIDDFGEGEPSTRELHALMLIFQARRDNERPIIASSPLDRSDVVGQWKMGTNDPLLARKTDWRFFKDAQLVEAH